VPFFSEGVVGMITLIPLIMLAFMGFYVAPQAVEETNVPLRKVVFFDNAFTTGLISML
jgi:amino acid transporter